MLEEASKGNTHLQPILGNKFAEYISGMCPPGHTCFPTPAGPESRCYEICNGHTGADVGPPDAAGDCPAGSTLILNVCCTTFVHRSPTKHSELAWIDSYNEPLSSKFICLAAVRFTFSPSKFLE